MNTDIQIAALKSAVEQHCNAVRLESCPFCGSCAQTENELKEISQDDIKYYVLLEVTVGCRSCQITMHQRKFYGYSLTVAVHSIKPIIGLYLEELTKLVAIRWNARPPCH